MPRRSALRVRRRLRAGAVVCLGLACAPARPAVKAGTVAVLPFTVEPSTETWMGEPLAEETARALSRVGDTVVRVAPVATAAFRLEVTLSRGRHLTIRSNLTSSTDQAGVYSHAYELPAESLTSVPDLLSAEVLAAFGRTVRVPTSPTGTAAYVTYLRALAYRHSDAPADLRWAAELFRQVLSADSSFGPAWQELAAVLDRVTDGGLHATPEEMEELRHARAWITERGWSSAR